MRTAYWFSFLRTYQRKTSSPTMRTSPRTGLLGGARTAFVEDAAALDLGPGSFVVEVASNDGYLLQHTVAVVFGPSVSNQPPTSLRSLAAGY